MSPVSNHRGHVSGNRKMEICPLLHVWNKQTKEPTNLTHFHYYYIDALQDIYNYIYTSLLFCIV